MLDKNTLDSLYADYQQLTKAQKQALETISLAEKLPPFALGGIVGVLFGLVAIPYGASRQGDWNWMGSGLCGVVLGGILCYFTYSKNKQSAMARLYLMKEMSEGQIMNYLMNYEKLKRQDISNIEMPMETSYTSDAQ
jgi:hypothetical protein